MKIILAMTMLMTSTLVQADLAAQKAWTIHNRIAGVPPAPGSGVLENMAQQIRNNPGEAGLESAARIAMQNRYFYDLTLKNWVKPWSNVERTKRVELNDFVATIVGAIRDSDQTGKPFNRILYSDLVYVGAATGDENNNFSRSNNNHYAAVESSQNLMLSLSERVQSSTINTETIADQDLADQSNLLINGNNGSAGVLTSRAAGEAFFSAGTNRRATRYLMVNFMCKDFEDVHDSNIPATRVRKDVDRSPGGDSRVFQNKCVGCHAGQDSMGGAFAYYDFEDGALKYEPGVVQAKMTRAAIFAGGHETTDDSWLNYWGQFSIHNQELGFKAPFSGNGVASLGRAVATSRGFSLCMSKKVFKLMCVRPPGADDNTFINNMADELENNNQYNMKNIIAKTVAHCVEEKYE